MKTPHLAVSIVIAMRNAATTVKKTLDSVEAQAYPIKEIIIIDNASTDDSVPVVEKWERDHHRIALTLICRRVNVGVGANYNAGVRMARSTRVVLLHADSYLPTRNELRRLVQPFREDSQVVTTGSFNVLPFDVWSRYPFWEKCLLARSVGKGVMGLNGKFDCYDKKVFLSIGGFNTTYYGVNAGVGSEDADIALRLQKVGKVAESAATVVHLHTLDSNYRFADWIANRKLLARSYGRLIRVQGTNLTPKALSFLIKPFIAFASIIPQLLPYSLFLLFGFSIWYMWPMYRFNASRSDSRIILLPFITALLILYESFWMLESFLFLPKKKV